MTHLEELGTLIQRVQDFERTKEQLEKSLSDVDKRLAHLKEHDIPALMDCLGMDKITTTDGWEIKVGDAYHTSITEANRQAAFTWLRYNGHGALIKSIVSSRFDAGEEALAEKAATLLTNSGFSANIKEEVNAQTLKGFVREQKEAGNDIPDDVFGIYHKREIKMKRKN